MSTIKDVAKLAGVSVSTVSFVANGRDKERRISKETRDKVLNAMRDLDYRPNMQARLLRNSETAIPMIALFRPVDPHYAHRSAIFDELHSAFSARDFDCELVIKPFSHNHIDRAMALLRHNSANYYSGAIITGATPEDTAYLESIDFSSPLILLNNSCCQKYTTIGVHDSAVGREAANLIHARGYSRAAAFITDSFLGVGTRYSWFQNTCADLGVEINASWVYYGTPTLAGGIQAASLFLATPDRPSVIYCESDAMALGALYTFRQEGIRVPEDVEILTLAVLEEELTKYSCPPISVISMPYHKICSTAADLMIQAITTRTLPTTHIQITPDVVLRESFSFNHPRAAGHP